MVQGTRNFDNVATSSYSQSISVQTTAQEDTDSLTEPGFWQSNNWKKNNGYYNTHNSVKTIINKIGMWSVGKGSKANEKTKKILSKIRGNGKDSFNEIMKNQIRVRHIDGDSYAEIVRDRAGKLINVKSLNPGRMKVYFRDNNMISHYGYTNGQGEEQRFELDEIFHLSLNRNADEIHGTGDIDAIMTYLDKIKQLDEDMGVMFHRYVVPMIIWKLQTDKPGEINKFKSSAKTARDGGQDVFIPQKAVEWDLVEAGKNGIDPLEWRRTWVEEVTKGGGVPALIMAIEASTTEASSRMVYLAWEQVIQDEQLYLEDQIRLQLRLDVNFEFPASIEESLDVKRKEGSLEGEKKSDIKPQAPTKPEVKKT